MSSVSASYDRSPNFTFVSRLSRVPDKLLVRRLWCVKQCVAVSSPPHRSLTFLFFTAFHSMQLSASRTVGSPNLLVGWVHFNGVDLLELSSEDLIA